MSTEISTSEEYSTNARVFRTLVVINVVSYLALLVCGFSGSRFYAAEAADFLAWRGYGATIPPNPVYFYINMPLYLVSSARLYRFSWIGRLVFTSLTAFDSALLPFGGIGIITPLETLPGMGLTLSSGGILALGWTRPVAGRFSRSRE